MSAPNWPTTLPKYLSSDSFNLEPNNNLVVSTMDVGPAKMRPRFTGTWFSLSASLTLSAEQWATLWSFYSSTLAFGSMRFNWVNPVTRAPCVMRFNPKSVPSITDTIGASSIVALSLEILS